MITKIESGCGITRGLELGRINVCLKLSRVFLRYLQKLQVARKLLLFAIFIYLSERSKGELQSMVLRLLSIVSVHTG